MNKSDVRIVTSIDGFVALKQFVNSYLNKNIKNLTI